MEICWINGEVIPARQARVNVLDHGLLYGDGVFEGLRFRHGRVFRLDTVLRRLSRSAAAIGLTLPMSLDQMKQAVDELIDAYAVSAGFNHGYIRLVVTRGVGKLGIDPASCQESGIFMIAGELSMVSKEVREQGATLITASTRKPGPGGLDPRIKSLNYLTNIMARMEAAAAGAEEAVMLNQAGYVAEGTA
ncbi:MAG: aminotransferase class IV, partial [Nitrospinota bacterium]|nr:aminotransferase class IV [Nitrospinota bacterium]